MRVVKIIGSYGALIVLAAKNCLHCVDINFAQAVASVQNLFELGCLQRVAGSVNAASLGHKLFKRVLNVTFVALVSSRIRQIRKDVQLDCIANTGAQVGVHGLVVLIKGIVVAVRRRDFGVREKLCDCNFGSAGSFKTAKCRLAECVCNFCSGSALKFKHADVHLLYSMVVGNFALYGHVASIGGWVGDAKRIWLCNAKNRRRVVNVKHAAGHAAFSSCGIVTYRAGRISSVCQRRDLERPVVSVYCSRLVFDNLVCSGVFYRYSNAGNSLVVNASSGDIKRGAQNSAAVRACYSNLRLGGVD